MRSDVGPPRVNGRSTWRQTTLRLGVSVDSDGVPSETFPTGFRCFVSVDEFSGFTALRPSGRFAAAGGSGENRRYSDIVGQITKPKEPLSGIRRICYFDDR